MTQTIEITRARFMGTTDDVTTCDCCGRTGLKSTVAVSLDGEADPVFYGVTCAAHALRTTAKAVRSEARAADERKAEAAREAFMRRSTVEGFASAVWLDRELRARGLYGAAGARRWSRFDAIQALGGWAAFSAAYEPHRGAFEAGAWVLAEGQPSTEILRRSNALVY